MAVTRQALIDIFCRQNPEFAEDRPDPGEKTEEVKGVLSMPSSPGQLAEGYLYIGTIKQMPPGTDPAGKVWTVCVSDHADPACENLLVTDKDAGYVLNAFHIAFQTLSVWEREVDIALAQGSSLQQILNLSAEMIELAVIVYDPSLRKVFVIEMQEKLCAEACPVHYRSMVEDYWTAEPNFSSAVNATCTKVTKDGVYFLDEDGNECFEKAGSIVLATGAKLQSDEAMAYFGKGTYTSVIGDCVKAAGVQQAMRTGYAAGRKL